MCNNRYGAPPKVKACIIKSVFGLRGCSPSNMYTGSERARANVRRHHGSWQSPLTPNASWRRCRSSSFDLVSNVCRNLRGAPVSCAEGRQATKAAGRHPAGERGCAYHTEQPQVCLVFGRGSVLLQLQYNGSRKSCVPVNITPPFFFCCFLEHQ